MLQSQRLDSEVLKFLVVGALAALINWLARFPLSWVMTFEHAVIGAYAIGMVSGYLLYRRYVFTTANSPVWLQVTKFAVVNAVGIVVVTLVASALARIVLPQFLSDQALIEAIAHGAAIGTSAVTSFFGHKWFTFARRPEPSSTRAAAGD